jgi:hypothetical protein
MYFLRYIGVLSIFIVIVLFITINFSVPPALSAQIDIKTMTPIKLNTYVDNYKSDN